MPNIALKRTQANRDEFERFILLPENPQEGATVKIAADHDADKLMFEMAAG